jgi:polar amino acid transport system substrate-binding protein
MRRSPARPRLLAAALLALFTLAPGGARAAGAEAGGAPRPIVVGADPDYPPYEFLDARGQPSGYNVDLTRAIAEVMGMQVEFRFGDWAEIRRGLVAGEIDALQGITFSEERARTLDFSSPHAIVHHAIFARKGAPAVDGLEELAGKDVIVFGGGIMDEALTRLGHARLVRTGTPADALRRLASGKGDYVALALLPGVYIQRELALTNVAPVATRVAAEPYGYAVRKGDAELLARFDTGLAILKKTGRYDAIHARWLGPLEARSPDLRTIAKWAGLGALPVLLALGLTVLWSRSLRRLVAQRTASLEREVAEKNRAVDELRQHQAELVQADKMAALGVLVSGVAHEINNPNGLVLLALPTLKAAFADAAPVLDERHRDDPALRVGGIPWGRMRDELPRLMDEMQAAGRRIKHTVEDLKDFARREDAPPVGAVDLNAAARDAVRLVDATIRNATSRFEVELAEGLPVVRGIERRIEQVVVNLLVNACHALPSPDRRVRLSTRHERARGAVVLEVEDEGVGIPPEHLSRITDPFFTTRREAGGTGLGLSVSARIAKEHGGALEFVSTAGVGTRAALVLPVGGEEG